MKRLLLGILLGIAVSATARGQEGSLVLTELPMETLGRTIFQLPKEYGRLAEVAVSAEVHYLYFEDPQGTIRVVPVGRRGAVQRSRTQLHLLSSDVYLVERGNVPRVSAGKPEGY